VKGVVGYALYLAQIGEKSDRAKPLHAFAGAGVLEIREPFDGQAFRVVYTVRPGDVVYVLHAFQKKSKRGIKTPKEEIDVVRARLKRAETDHANRRNP
jgi:phage-related protein